MKYIISAIFFITVALSGAVSSSDPVMRSAQTCGDPSDALPFYRSYRSSGVDHYYTTNVELVSASIASSSPPYVLQEVAAFVFATQEEPTIPFYRLYKSSATDNLYTTNTTERDNAIAIGYVPVASDPFTYIYPTQICGSVPFYRLYNAAKIDNFYSTSESERLDFIANQGYEDVEIAGYVLPSTASQCP
ncbi:hypothetical protein B0H16DRAFT_1720782 [Mycena metata]|uniref:DUF5648 domain-containing protein n=1 Tax=Mycena metata TaxID=1033252 RepID=A0AAD7NFE4_9AGAR|nr:hypothetical protein B0H16DRAFT_1720782 [Mycena metata]